MGCLLNSPKLPAQTPNPWPIPKRHGRRNSFGNPASPHTHAPLTLFLSPLSYSVFHLHLKLPSQKLGILLASNLNFTGDEAALQLQFQTLRIQRCRTTSGAQIVNASSRSSFDLPSLGYRGRLLQLKCCIDPLASYLGLRSATAACRYRWNPSGLGEAATATSHS